MLLSEIHKLTANGSLEDLGLWNPRGAGERKGDRQPRECEIERQVVSHMFGVVKSSGACRPVINLTTINPYVKATHFKMEGLGTVRDLLRPNDWMTVVDLADAFHHVPLHPDHRRFFRFRFAGRLYQFRAMPFGYRDAPRMFTMVMKVIAEEARARGLRIVVYIDDILTLSDTKEQAIQDRSTLLELLQEFGMGINWAKSQLEPAQLRRYLGVMVDSVSMTFSLPAERLTKTLKVVNALIRRAGIDAGARVHVRTLRQAVGILMSTADCVLQCRIRLNALIECLRVAEAATPPVALITPRALSDLRWWSTHLPAMRKAVQPPLPRHVFDTDASHHGWGATCLGSDGARTEAHGFFTTEMSSNQRELTAISNGVRSLISQLKWTGCHVRVRTDNQCAMSYVNRMGGRAAPLNRITESMHTFCHERGITLTAEYLPGEENTRADTLSRLQADMSESRLDKTLFEAANRRWGPYTLDAFASMVNCQTPRYVSYRADPTCLYTDYLSRTAPTGENVWAFPPFCLIGRLLAKVARERSTISICVPHWPYQPWWPVAASMLIDYPLLLPRGTPNGVLHTPLDGAMSAITPSWAFAVLRLCGEPSKCRAFRTLALQHTSTLSEEARMAVLIERTMAASSAIESTAESLARARSICRPWISPT